MTKERHSRKMHIQFCVLLCIFLLLALILFAWCRKPKPRASCSLLGAPAVSCSQFPRLSEEVYLKHIFPACTHGSLSDLDFFYACAPARLEELYSVYWPWRHGYQAPPKGVLWPPVWTPACCYAVNHYDASSFWTFQPRDSDRDFIEGFHIRDDNPLYAVEGLWVYAARGAGVRYFTGQTLRVPCKILAFAELGLQAEDVASLIHNPLGSMHAMPTVARTVNIAEEALRLCPPPEGLGTLAATTWSLVRMIEILTRLYKEGDTQGRSAQDLYDLDRLNNSADFDLYLIPMARAAGYDSLQFYTQANGMGGWAHEVVLLQAKVLYKPEEAKWQGWKEMAHLMRDACGNACAPDVSHWMGLCESMEMPSTCLGAANVLPTGYAHAPVATERFTWPDGGSTRRPHSTPQHSVGQEVFSKAILAAIEQTN